ncbi:hypothetical protein ACHWQZ_G001516 [Mnemiopsis leidyi]
MSPSASVLDRSQEGNTGNSEHRELKGYEFAVIIVCFLIISAIFMCYLTWRCRYKIVLRTTIKEPTVVQNLVALTLQEAVRIEEITSSIRPSTRRVSRLSTGVWTGTAARETVSDKSGYGSERRLRRIVSESGGKLNGSMSNGRPVYERRQTISTSTVSRASDQNKMKIEILKNERVKLDGS